MSQNQLAIIQAVEGPIDPLSNLRLIDSSSTQDDYIGKDWAEKPSNEKEALLDYEYRYLRTDILANVRFIESLGIGAYGQVWEVSAQLKVKDEYPFESVWKRLRIACKIIHHKNNEEMSILDSLNEMRILRYLRHKNICNFIDIIYIPDRITGFPFSKVVMFFELCDGSLDDLFQKSGVFPEKLSRHWFAQIAKAIEYLHSNGTVHQDIHPGNILYCGPNVEYGNYEQNFLSSIFKLADFGGSRDIDLTPDIYEWTAERHQLSQINDIDDLFRTLYETGVSRIKSGSIRDINKNKYKFFDYCRTGLFEANFPNQWKQISRVMKDMLCRLHDSTNRITAAEILRHPWLQTNDEPPTKFRRESQTNLEAQPSHSRWEEATEHPFKNPDFESLFGIVRHQYNYIEPIEQGEVEE